jgi:hypothetical protein
MFDGQNNNEWDLQMRSILESGQEEVPAHIWDGVSSGLDALARRRKAVVFFRRAAIGLSAAAALAFGLFLNHSSEDVNVGAVAEIINPVDEAAVSVVDQEAGTEALTAMAPEPVIKPKFRGILPSASKATTEVPSTTDNTATHSVQNPTVKSNSQETVVPVVEKTDTEKKGSADTDNWIEEDKEIKSRKNSASLVLSGVAGTNSAQNRTATAAIRRPTLSAAPAKTAVTQTEPGDIYSIPLSFGVGTKIDFNSKWSLGVGVNYTLLNRKFFGDYTRVEEDRIVESIKSDIRNTQHYIGIPINAYYNIVENRFVNFYAYAGGTVEKCVSDEYRVISKDILHKESVKGVQASANLGIGVEFLLGKHIGLYVDPSARYYFNCNQPKSIRTAQPLMLGFEMGLRVRL